MLLFSEKTDLLYELLSLARSLADKNGWTVEALTIAQSSAESNEIIARGADTVLNLQSASSVGSLQPQQVAAVLEHITQSDHIVMVLLAATKEGNEIATRLAQKLGIGCATGCLEVQVQDKTVLAWRPYYGGKFVGKVSTKLLPAVITIQPRKFNPSLPSPDRAGKRVTLEFKLPPPHLEIIRVERKAKSAMELEKAEIIVSAGRGFKKKEDLELVEELAETLGGTVAGTRPLTEDMNWLPTDSQVGLSGKKVKPRLYIACGVSGQIQHIIGMRDSKVVVSINIDPNASIFDESDYYIVGDLYKVLPALTKVLKEIITK